MVSHCCVLCVRCPGGSYGNRPGLASVDDCIAVGEGFWAPIGSPQSIPCPATGFYCPGKVLDTKYGGARPIIIPVGQSTVIEEAELVNKEMTLDISLDEYDEEALRKSLATLYSVPAELIELSAPTVQTRRSRSLQAYSVQSRSGVAMHTPRALQSASGLQITITISAPPSTPSAPGSSTSLTSIMAAIAAVDDVTLAASLGVPVSSNAAIISSVQRITVSVCPRGYWYVCAHTHGRLRHRAAPPPSIHRMARPLPAVIVCHPQPHSNV